jgi:acetyl esterase
VRSVAADSLEDTRSEEHHGAPLADFDSDVRPLVEAFRSAGAVSFQNLPVPDSRAAYQLSCARNGLPRAAVESVENRVIPTQGASVPIRVYRAKGTRADDALPCMLFIHGGGWVIGDLETHDGICRHLANATGGSVIAVDYRRSPEHKHPIPLQDCADVLSALPEIGRELGVDPKRIALAGDSAGANMAAVLALRSRNGELPSVSGQVLFYPVTDLASESASYARVTDGVPLTAGSMRWFRDHYLTPDHDATDWNISPLRVNTLAGSPPAFVVTVGHDPLSDEGAAYANRLALDGVQTTHHHLPHHMHGLLTSARVVSTAGPLLSDAAAFIRRTWQSADATKGADRTSCNPS